MTSLAQQLQRLAVPYTQSVLSEDKRRASLLFDPKDAATLDRETVFALGASGLEELETLDSGFAEYSESLFNQTTQNWERNLQTKEVNEQLDKTIEEFLIRLSPYFLLKSAHKALEWLIYRYHVHQSNVEELMLCILPYHETNIFVRVVQLLPIESPNNKWNWIKPAAKGGVPLTRSVVVNHCVKDPSFLNFLCEMLPKFIKVHGAESNHLKSVVAFHTCTLLGGLQDRENVTERMVGVLVPHVIRGLKSRCLDHKAGTYMILAQLAIQHPLNEDFLSRLLTVLTKHISPRLAKEAVSCLAVVLHTQKISQFTKKSFKYLCRIPALVVLLANLGAAYDLGPLLAALLDRLIPAGVHAGPETSSSSGGEDGELTLGRPDYHALLETMLQDLALSDTLAESVARSVLMEILALCKKMDVNEDDELSWKQAARSFLTILDRRYPSQMDAAVEMLFRDLEQEDAVLMQEIISMTTGGVKHQLLGDTSTSLFFGMNHPQPSMRMMAVRQLAKTLKEKKPMPSDFAESLILERLKDDNPEVVLEVLKISELLIAFADHKTLISTLLGIVSRSYRSAEWSEVLKHTVLILCSEPLVSADEDLVADLLTYMLATSPNDLVIAKTVLQSKWAPKHSLLGTFSKKWLGLLEKQGEAVNVGELNTELVRGLASSLLKIKAATTFKSLLEDRSSRAKTDPRFALLALCCCGEMLTNASETQLVPITRTALFVIQAINIKKSKRVDESDFGATLVSWLRRVDKVSAVPDTAVTMTLKKVIEVVPQLLKLVKGTSWWSVDDEAVKCVQQLAEVLVSQACKASSKENAYNSLLNILIMEKLSSEQLSRLCEVIWANEEQVSPSLHAASLYLLARKWKSAEPQSVTKQLNKMGGLASLLMCLQFEHASIRQGALCCLQTVRDLCGANLAGNATLIKKLLKHQEEILADPNHVAFVIANVFNKDGCKGHKELLDDLSDTQTPLKIKLAILKALCETPYKISFGQVTSVGQQVMTLLSCESQASALHLAVMGHVLRRIRADSAGELSRESHAFVLLLDCLGPAVQTGVAKLALAQVDKEMFQALPSVECKQRLTTALLDLLEKTKSSDIASLASKVLRKVKLEGDNIRHELRIDATEPGLASPATVKGRRKTRQVAGASGGRTVSWKRTSLVLEALQSRKSFKNPEAIMQLLFAVLEKLLKEEGEQVEYCKKLVLLCLHGVTSKWMPGETQPAQESFHLEALVQCIRSSSNLQTQQQALLVMASVAHFFPEYILHNVMSVFTFVGSGLLQQDDSHSLQVITYTIETVISALLKTQEEKQDRASAEKTIAGILQVFVDARQAVPRHRCLLVFRCLTNTLSPHRYLWLALTLLTLSRAGDPQNMDIPMEESENPPWGSEEDLEFILNLSEQFDNRLQMAALTEILRYLVTLHELHSQVGKAEKTQKQLKMKSPVVDVASLSPQQLRMFQFHLTKLISAVLAREAFVTQVVTQLESQDTTVKSACEEDFQTFLKVALQYMTTVSRSLGRGGGQKVTVKFGKAILSKTYEIFDKVNYLLPTEILLHLVCYLVEDEVMSTRRKALDLLSSKLQQLQPQLLTDNEKTGLLKLTELLIAKTTDTASVAGSEDHEHMSFTQLMLFCLKLLCKLLAHDNPKAFLKLYKVSGDLVKEQKVAAPVLSSSLLCIAELCASMGAHTIPHLSVIVPPLLSLLSNAQLMLRQELLLTCGVTALQKLMTSLPHFLSPYLTDIISLTCVLGQELHVDDMNRKSQAVQRVRAVRHQLATVVPPRVLLPALSKCFDKLSTSNQAALGSLMTLVKLHLESMSKEDLASQNSAIFTFFCQALNLRNIELQMYDWACRDDSAQGPNKNLTFFRLADRLADKLKGLFNLFVRHTLQVACKLLDLNNTTQGEVKYFGSDLAAESKSCQLLTYILGMLHKCMTYDSEGLFEKDVFNMLHRPLVDQIENFAGGESRYEERITSSVIPCISQFAVASRDDAAWKTLNYQVLLKTRHSSAKVRFAAIQVVEAMAQKLGEEYMVLVPETIPFLAELMEDEAEEVEQQCQKVIASMEDVLGESLQKYF